jgi:hypothetical protein
MISDGKYGGKSMGDAMLCGYHSSSFIIPNSIPHPLHVVPTQKTERKGQPRALI